MSLPKLQGALISEDPHVRFLFQCLSSGSWAQAREHPGVCIFPSDPWPMMDGWDTWEQALCFRLLCPMSESTSGKREGLQDNATGKRGKFITDSSQGPLPHPTQWCRSESPEPKLLHKFIGGVHAVGLSGLVTSLQSNFIGQNFCASGTFLGISARFLIS